MKVASLRFRIAAILLENKEPWTVGRPRIIKSAGEPVFGAVSSDLFGARTDRHHPGLGRTAGQDQPPPMSAGSAVRDLRKMTHRPGSVRGVWPGSAYPKPASEISPRFVLVSRTGGYVPEGEWLPGEPSRARLA